MLKLVRHSLTFFFYLMVPFVQADVLPVQTFKTPAGFDVWLVEDHTSPVISLVFTFEKAKFDFQTRAVILLLTHAINNGAGILSFLEMRRFIKETPSWRNIEVGISKNIVNLKTTKEGLEPTLKLWSKLLSNPHFNKANLEHSKTQTLTSIASLKENLEVIAYLNLLKTIFPKASLKTDLDKEMQTVKTLTADNLEKENGEQFLNRPFKIVVVGDINKNELIKFLDSTFGAGKSQPVVSKIHSLKPLFEGKEVIVKKDVPQSLVTFAQKGINPTSKEYPQYLLFQSILDVRFFDELRTKRGLIYSINFIENHYNEIDILTGDFSCECSLTSHIIKFIRSEWERLKDFGITQKELSDAKLRFKRSHVFNLTSTDAVAHAYAEFQGYNLGPDAANTLLKKTESITLEDINTFVRQFLKPEQLTFVVIGSFDKKNNLKEKK